MRSRILAVGIPLIFACGRGWTQTLAVTLDSPQDRAEVPALPCISGRVTNSKARLVAVVRAMESGDIWVQKTITLGADGRYEAMINAGEQSVLEHNGKWLEVRVLGNPRGELHEGERLANWPMAEALSNTVRVMRKDGAPDGCGASRPVRPKKIEIVNQSSTSLSPPMVDSGWFPAVALGGVAIVLALVLVALAVMPESAEGAVELLMEWLRNFRNWLMGLAGLYGAKVLQFGKWLRDSVSCTVPLLWSARGYRGDLRQFSVSSLLTLPLTFATVTALYGEAITIWKGLIVLFGTDDAGPNSTGGILGDLLPGAPAVASLVANGWEVRASEVLPRLAGHLMQSFEKLWGEQFGFLAIAMAGLQGAFGIVLLWGMGTEQPLRLRLLGLLQERPLVTALFLTLNLTLVILAANRGSEVTLHGNWVIVAIISGLLALAMSWILALSTHYCFECAADCLAVSKAIALIGGLVAGAFGMFCLVAALGLSVMAVTGAVFAIFFLLSVTAAGFALFAKLMGELARCLRVPPLLPASLRAGVRPVAAALAALAAYKVKNYRFWLALVLAASLMAPTARAQTLRPRSYQAWAICIDRSLSPDEEQFRKLLAILRMIVEDEVSYNDVVWLIDIEAGQRPVQAFSMPGHVRLRSEGIDEAKRLQDAKEVLLGSVERMSQVSRSTNLQIPIETALEMLRTQVAASRRIMIVGSDFLTDSGKDRASLEPPPVGRDDAAATVDALLLVTYPKPKWFNLLGITSIGLFRKIEAGWSTFLTSEHASSVRVRLVDSVPIKSGNRAGGMKGQVQ